MNSQDDSPSANKIAETIKLWFPTLGIVGLIFHSIWTESAERVSIQSMQSEFVARRDIPNQIMDLKARSINHEAILSDMKQAAKDNRSEILGSLQRINDKQDVSEAKLNRILGAIDKAKEAHVAVFGSER